MAKKATSNKKLNKGKKVAIIAGCAAAGEALLGLAATVAVPLTGGATAPLAAAMYAASGKSVAIAAGAAAGGAAVGVVATKVVDGKRESKAYGDGYNDASKAYESKFATQAEEFAQEQEKWAQTKRSWEHTQEEKDELLRKCLLYIKDLEKERDSLKAENKALSAEKQELLDKLYGIRDKLRLA